MPLQTSRAACKPAGLKDYHLARTAVALIDLQGRLGLGCSRWIRQFVFGFPLVGGIYQCWVHPRYPSAPMAGDPPDIWAGNTDRFILRGRSSGALYAQRLWAVTIGQGDKGRLGNRSE